MAPLRKRNSYDEKTNPGKINRRTGNHRKKILLMRGKKIMLDRDLAELYGVETKYLTRQVRRNIDRFPSDFLLHLTQQEVANLKRHFGRSSWGGTRKLPFAFTEHGILMLSSVLNSKRAVQVNIQIMRTFTKLREMLAGHVELRRKIEEMERKYDCQFKIVFDVRQNQRFWRDLAKLLKQFGGPSKKFWNRRKNRRTPWDFM